jgi:hypothetical protein
MPVNLDARVGKNCCHPAGDNVLDMTVSRSGRDVDYLSEIVTALREQAPRVTHKAIRLALI